MKTQTVSARKAKASAEALGGAIAAKGEETENGSRRSGRSSLTRMLSILDLFTPETPVWSTNDLIEKLGTSRSTSYRYIKELHQAGLIGAVGNGYYVLGPRIVELDLQIRQCDPLHKAGDGVLEKLSRTTGHSALLCTLFSNSMLCIREHLGPSSPENMFSRGQRRPLFFGSPSKIVLPHLPSHRLRSIYNRNARTIADARLGRSWEEFKETLAKLRRDGYARTVGELNPGVVGISAPVFNSEGLILGSIGVAWREADTERDEPAVIAAVKSAARTITERVSTTETEMDRPPRAVG
jgi:DNA-binding IclR family transcriptional regulator